MTFCFKCFFVILTYHCYFYHHLMIKKIFIFFIISFLFAGYCNAQIPVKINEKSIDSVFYRNSTKWILFTPLFIVKQEFSPDKGETWEKVGMLGGNVKPYLLSDSIATENIQLYKYTRLAGIVQMWIIAPLLAYKHFTYSPNEIISTGVTSIDLSTNTREESGYLTAAIIVFLTGTLTYHVLSKNYLYRSLHDYNHGILNHEKLKNTSFNFDVKLDKRSQVPQLSLIVSF